MPAKLEALNAKIKETQTKLTALYAARKELINSQKTRHKGDAEKKQTEALRLARGGKDLQEICSALSLKPSTVRHYLWSAVWEATHTPNTPFKREVAEKHERRINDMLQSFPAIKFRHYSMFND